MERLFDAYEFRARLLPAIVVGSPLIFAVAILLATFQVSQLNTVLVALVVFALVYALSLIVRHLGKVIEPKIWASWGGAPSILMLRPDDSTLNQDIRRLICAGVKRRFSINIADPNLSPAEYDRCVENAFRLVRQHVQRFDPHGLWYKHNAEYGFIRNLHGAWWLWALFGGIAAVGGVGGFLLTANAAHIFIIVIGASSLATAWVLHRYVLLALLRTAAERYAESTWMSFVNLELSQPERLERD